MFGYCCISFVPCNLNCIIALLFLLLTQQYGLYRGLYCWDYYMQLQSPVSTWYSFWCFHFLFQPTNSSSVETSAWCASPSWPLTFQPAKHACLIYSPWAVFCLCFVNKTVFFVCPILYNCSSINKGFAYVNSSGFHLYAPLSSMTENCFYSNESTSRGDKK